MGLSIIMGNKMNIARDELRKLYFDDKLSMEEIGKKYDYNHVTIINRFREYGWKSRGHLGNRTPIGITKVNLSKLYFEKNLPAASIAKIIHHTKSGVETKMRSWGLIGRGNNHRVHHKYKKINFSKNKLEKAYLIGFRLGDLNVRLVKTVIMVRCSSTIYQQVALIRSLFSQYGGVNLSKARRGTYEINCYLDNTFDFLIPKWEKIPKWILNDRDTFLSFLAGYADAEGYFDATRDGLRISSQQKAIIFECCEGLNRFGFMCNTPIIVRRAGHVQKDGVINNKDMWSFAIYKRSTTFSLMSAILPYLRHLHKKKAAETIVKQLLSKISKL